MKKIFKYRITHPLDVISLPEGAEILCVQIQHELPCIWALVDPDAPLVQRRFIIVGTGQDISNVDSSNYIGTFQQAQSSLIWHLFELE